MKLSRTKRQALLDHQDGQCAICGNYQESTSGMCYVIDKNALLCRLCNTTLCAYRNALKRGVTPDILEAFLGQTSQAGTGVVSDRRRMVESGQLVYDGFEIRNGVWVNRFTGEPEPNNRPFKDWAEALRCHPEWAEDE